MGCYGNLASAIHSRRESLERCSASILLLRFSDEELKKVVFNITPPSAPTKVVTTQPSGNQGPQRIGNKNDAGEPASVKGFRQGVFCWFLFAWAELPKSAQL
jgi:hypothetical protein